MTIQLHAFDTPNGRKITVALEEMGLPYDVHVVDITKNEQFAPDFLKISPNNKIPAIVDPDGPGGRPISVFESGAILLYLAEKYPQGNLLPQALDERARVYKWLVWQPATFNPPRQRLVAELAKPEPARDAQAVAALRATIARNLEILAEALGGNDYLLGRYTLADLVQQKGVLLKLLSFEEAGG